MLAQSPQSALVLVFCVKVFDMAYDLVIDFFDGLVFVRAGFPDSRVKCANLELRPRARGSRDVATVGDLGLAWIYENRQKISDIPRRFGQGTRDIVPAQHWQYTSTRHNASRGFQCVQLTSCGRIH